MRRPGDPRHRRRDHRHQLQRIALPSTLETIEKGAFNNAKNLRYIDFLQCDAEGIVTKLQAGAFQALGVDTLRTLVYLPAHYGAPAGTNIVVATGAAEPEASAEGPASVLPFRAYLLPSARTAGAPSISMHLENLIDIDTLETIDRDGTHRYYDLQGHEVTGSYRGIIIKNGKKYINK